MGWAFSASTPHLLQAAHHLPSSLLENHTTIELRTAIGNLLPFGKFLTTVKFHTKVILPTSVQDVVCKLYTAINPAIDQIPTDSLIDIMAAPIDNHKAAIPMRSPSTVPSVFDALPLGEASTKREDSPSTSDNVSPHMNVSMPHESVRDIHRLKASRFQCLVMRILLTQSQ